MLFLISIKSFFFNLFLFLIILFIVSIAGAIKNMSVNQIRDFISKKLLLKNRIFQGQQLLFNETLEKKTTDLMLLANRLIKNINHL